MSRKVFRRKAGGVFKFRAEGCSVSEQKGVQRRGEGYGSEKGGGLRFRAGRCSESEQGGVQVQSRIVFRFRAGGVQIQRRGVFRFRARKCLGSEQGGYSNS